MKSTFSFLTKLNAVKNFIEKLTGSPIIVNLIFSLVLRLHRTFVVPENFQESAESSLIWFFEENFALL